MTSPGENRLVVNLTITGDGDEVDEIKRNIFTMQDDYKNVEFDGVMTSQIFTAHHFGTPNYLGMPIEEFLPRSDDRNERPRNCLLRAQIMSVGALLQRTENDLLNITNFGQKSLDRVKELLEPMGLHIRER